MNEETLQQRVERAVFETDRHRVVGDVTLPALGYRNRLSDALNRPEIDFLPLTNVEITSLEDGEASEQPFLILAKCHVRLAHPVEP